MQDRIFDSRQGGSASDDMTAARFQCPFADCAKYYRRNSDVRKHVRRKHPAYQVCRFRGCQVFSPKGDNSHLAAHQFVQGTTNNFNTVNSVLKTAENQTLASGASTGPRLSSVSPSINTQANEMSPRLPSVDGTGNSTFASPPNQTEPATGSNIDATAIGYFHSHSLDMPTETTASFGPGPAGPISLPHRFIVPSQPQPQQYNTNADILTDTQEGQEAVSRPATSESPENSNRTFTSLLNDPEITEWDWGRSE